MSEPSRPEEKDVGELWRVNARLRQENQALRERIAAIETRLEERASVHWSAETGDPSELRIEAPETRSRGQQAVYPYRMLSGIREDLDSLYDRVSDLEAGEVDPTALLTGTEDTQLPIERVVVSVRNNRGEFSANEQRAAYVFQAFGARARPVNTHLVLDSHTVRTILTEDAGLESPNSNTVRRTMIQTAKLTSEASRGERVARQENGARDENLVWLESGRERLQLRVDRADWMGYLEDIEDRAITVS